MHSRTPARTRTVLRAQENGLRANGVSHELGTQVSREYLHRQNNKARDSSGFLQIESEEEVLTPEEDWVVSSGF